MSRKGIALLRAPLAGYQPAKFLSCKAFSVYEVVRVACLSRINVMYYCRRPGFDRTTGTEEIFAFLLDLCRTLGLSSY